MSRWIITLLVLLVALPEANAAVIKFRGAGALTAVDSTGSYFPEASVGDTFYFEYTIEVPDTDFGTRYQISDLSLTIDGRTMAVLPGTSGNNRAYIELIEYEFFGPSGTSFRDSYVIDAYSPNASEGLSLLLWSDGLSTVPSNFLVGNRHPLTALDLSLAVTNRFDYRSALGDSFHGSVTSLAPVPLPASAWLLLSAFTMLARRRGQRPTTAVTSGK